MSGGAVTIRIAMVDDHHMFRQSLKLLLQSQTSFEVVGEGQSADDACALASECAADVFLIDHVRMTRAVHNLVNNAVKFAPSGGHVVARVVRRADAVDVEVVDDGPGITAADLPLVFEPYRSDRTTEGAGRGIGLYIAQGIVRANGGEIKVEPGHNGGTKFSFSLPAVALPTTKEDRSSR